MAKRTKFTKRAYGINILKKTLEKSKEKPTVAIK